MNQYWIIALLSITSVGITILASFGLHFICIKNKLARRPSMLAIWNLLFAHLLQGIFVVPSYVVKRLELSDEGVYGFVCDTFRFSYLVTNYLSCLSLLLISADRMLAIKSPLLYRTAMTNSRMTTTILTCWIYTLTLCFIPFIPDSKSNSKCSYNPQKEWTLFMLTWNTMLPFIIIMYSYFIIFKSARSARILRSSISVNSSATHQKSERRDSELRIAKISSIIASAYLLCWGPSFVYYFSLAACPSCFPGHYFHSTAERVIAFLMKYLTFVNGIISPIIYCYRYGRIRAILPCCKRNQVATAVE